MWWLVKKISDNAEKVVYSYGFETDKQTGEIEFDRKTQDFTLTKLAENDNIKIVTRFLFRHLYRVIVQENCPAERQIAIG